MEPSEGQTDDQAAGGPSSTTATARTAIAGATPGASTLAQLYLLQALDPLIGCAEQVSIDFFDRPHLYTTIGGEADGNSVIVKIASLRSRCGHDERYPSWAQRRQTFSGLFGEPNGQGDFGLLRGALLTACTAFAERVYDTGVAMLRERVVAAHRPLREFITGLEGTSTEWSRDSIGNLATTIAYPILRDAGIAAVFGIATPPKSTWPFVEDANADKLIEQIQRQLGPGVSQVHDVGSLRFPLTRESVSSLQRVALRGAEALDAIIQFDEPSSGKDIDRLIARAYTWAAALAAIDGRDSPIAVVASLETHPLDDPPFAPSFPTRL